MKLTDISPSASLLKISKQNKQNDILYKIVDYKEKNWFLCPGTLQIHDFSKFVIASPKNLPSLKEKQFM